MWDAEHNSLLRQRHDLEDKVARLQAIVDKTPKDADGDPVEDGKSYFFRCANGALEFVAYLGPQTPGDRPSSYPWHKGHKTREAAKDK